MPVLKSPKYADHPADHLSKLVPEDIKSQFLRTPKLLLIENPIYADRLKELRNHFNYSYLVQWIYLLKHVIKLSDAFDVENFEEELLGIAPPVFINNLKIKLIHFLKNQKLQNIDLEFDFFVDQIYQDYNLLELNDDNDKSKDDNENNNVITYSKLPLLEQIDVLYNLVKLANTKNYNNFRAVVDKFDKPHLSFKIDPIFQINHKPNIKDEYIILQDARLYLRKWEFKNLNLPNYKSKSSFNEKFGTDNYDNLKNLEPKLIHWECLTSGIYQYDSLISDLKKSFGKKSSSNEYQLSKVLESNIDFIIQHDLKKRKQGAARKREIEMQLLMANRKRSSRLEEKERKRKEEEEQRMKELEIIKQQAAEIRAAKRQKLKDSMYGSTNNGIPLDSSINRGERLRKRLEMTQSPPPDSTNNPDGSDLIEVPHDQIEGNTMNKPSLIPDSPQTESQILEENVENPAELKEEPLQVKDDVPPTVSNV